MSAPRRIGFLAGLIGVYALAVRPALLRWGATDAEVAGGYPGAEIIPEGKRGATMATTIGALPGEVWPWLVQMGCDRAGWYSWDRLDNGGAASAERIHPEWQEIEVGDRFAATPDGQRWFEVAALEPQRFLALRASYDLFGHPFDPRRGRPPHYTDGVWCFLLEELPGERTRLVVSGYGDSRPWWIAGIVNFVFWEPAHWVMQARQFENLRRRCEDRGGAIPRRSPRRTSSRGTRGRPRCRPHVRSRIA